MTFIIDPNIGAIFVKNDPSALQEHLPNHPVLVHTGLLCGGA